jgi:phosphate-selective porin
MPVDEGDRAGRNELTPRDGARRVPMFGGLIGTLIGIGLLWVPPLLAQHTSTENPPTDQAPVSAASQPAKSSQPAADDSSWRFDWDEHPSLRFGKDTRIDFRLRMQGDIRDSEGPLGDDDDVDFARRRVGVEGRVKNLVDFEITREVADEDPWRDVYVNYRQFDVAEVQAGKFKLPFSLDENTGATNLDFVYRSMAASQLSPGRDRGVMVHGRLLERVLRYELGWFAHDGVNARNRTLDDVYGGGTTAGRITAQPFRSRSALLKDLQVGVAFTNSTVPEGFPGLNGHTALDAQLFPANVWVNGARRRVGLEARWRPGPASIKAEYIRVSTERLGQSVEDTDLSPLIGEGWYVSGTWALTGERKADDLSAPHRPLFRGGWGAIEVGARMERLQFGNLDTEIGSTSPRADDVLGNADRATTLGVNWYPIRHVKLQMNVIHERIADPSRGPVPSAPGFWSRAFRIQLDL